MIKKRVKQYIEKEKLFSPESKVFVALSGGADSVALLRLLHSIGYRCEAAHCNFHLRGTESDRDERFVRGLCRELGIPLHTTHFDTTGYAAEKHVSIEMAARDLRYEWFEKLRVEYRADAIAVAHHQDDSVETMLLNLIREQESKACSASARATDPLSVRYFARPGRKSSAICDTSNRNM